MSSQQPPPSSLRTRRPSAIPVTPRKPSIAPGSVQFQQPFQQRSKQNGGPPPAASSGMGTVRGGMMMDGSIDNRKSKVVTEKIKRRMSTRYIDPESGFGGSGSGGSFYTPSSASRQGGAGSNEFGFAGVGTGGGMTMPPPLPTPSGQEYQNLLAQQAEDDEEVAYRSGPNNLKNGAVDAGMLDLASISKEGFDPKAYIKSKLSGASEEEIRAFAATLEASKRAASADIQKNVFKNYAEFVLISKEIATLENDLLSLKLLLSEWKSVPELLTSLSSSDVPVKGGSLSNNLYGSNGHRNSIADLQTLYRTQLQTLWSTVQGSQKFVPLKEGRHVVHEARSFVELVPATYKVKMSVVLVLLDDLVLVAGRRKRRGALVEGVKDDDPKKGIAGGREEEKLVAERCWPLNEIVVIDVKDSGDLTNALKIRRGKETTIFRTDNVDAKRGLLSAFRQVADALAGKKRKEVEREQERRRSAWVGESPSMSSPNVPPLPTMPSLHHLTTGGALPGSRTSVLGLAGGGNQTDKEGRDIRWIDDFGDELAVAIAMREWEEAVTLVEKGKLLLSQFFSDPSTSHLLDNKLTPLRSSLLSNLCQSLSSPLVRKSSLARLVSLMLRLNEGPLARERFLEGRTKALRKATRLIRFEGDVPVYINELAMVSFTSIKHTADWFLGAWKENGMASGLVQWSKEQIEQFAFTFCKQVYGPDVDPSVVEESLEVTRTQSRRLLHDVGLDLSFHLLTLLRAPPQAEEPSPQVPTDERFTVFQQQGPPTLPPVPTVTGTPSLASIANGATLIDQSTVPPVPIPPKGPPPRSAARVSGRMSQKPL